MSTLALAEHQADVMASLRRLNGHATLGDLVADSGLPADQVRVAVKRLLQTHRGHLAVSDSGELLYEFDPELIERGTEPFLARAKRAVTKGLRAGFKAWIVTMLVVYFVVFVALVIAALVAGRRGDSRGGGWGGRRTGRPGLHVPDLWFWYWIWGPRWRLGRPYYGHRWERTLPADDKVPFYKKVFAFVFGPDRPVPAQKQIDRRTLRLIRARSGVLTTAELVQHTGASFDEAEEEMGRLLGAYDGEAAVSPDGELVYAFPEVMRSAHGRKVREPNPAWLRLEPPKELTGNTSGANALIVGMNTFTMAAAATAPWFIFPRLGLGGPAAFIGLVLVPLVFSVLFFTVPLLRIGSVALENRRRRRRNVRRVLLGLVYERALERGRGIAIGEAHQFVANRLKDQSVSRGHVETLLHDLAGELNADVTVDDEGTVLFRFDAIREQFAAGETVRRALALEDRELGEIVYATSDSPEEAAARELRLFDRALEAEEEDLARLLPRTDRVDFEDDFELVAFDEEMKMRRDER